MYEVDGIFRLFKRRKDRFVRVIRVIKQRPGSFSEHPRMDLPRHPRGGRTVRPAVGARARRPGGETLCSATAQEQGHSDRLTTGAPSDTTPHREQHAACLHERACSMLCLCTPKAGGLLHEATPSFHKYIENYV
jgi:hypothetical protein